MMVPLVTAGELLADAKKNRYAVGAFNANNLEFVQAIVSAAEQERAPVIVQASPGAIRYAGIDNIVALVGATASHSDMPVVLHLDHGDDIDLVNYCIRRGFTSVMFDGSRFSFAENVKLTAAVAKAAHRAGITAEGELGIIPGAAEEWSDEQLHSSMTDPAAAATFVSETGIDALAVAVGSIHQLRGGTTGLDTKRVREIARITGIPLVLHGSSGVSTTAITSAIREGICKVNVATAINEAFAGALRSSTRSLADEVDPRRLLSPARSAASEVVAERMRLFGCSGRGASPIRAAQGGHK